MRNVTVARRYARALYQLSIEQESLVDVLQGMSNLTQAVEHTPELRRMLLNPLLKPEIKQKLVAMVTSNKLVLKFTQLLAKRKRLDLLATVHEALLELGDAVSGIHRAIVKTALPLTDTQKLTIELELAKRMGGKILGHFEVAKDLIGGVWIKMGDKVLDATIKGRIDTFRQALRYSTN